MLIHRLSSFRRRNSLNGSGLSLQNLLGSSQPHSIAPLLVCPLLSCQATQELTSSFSLQAVGADGPLYPKWRKTDDVAQVCQATTTGAGIESSERRTECPSTNEVMCQGAADPETQVCSSGATATRAHTSCGKPAQCHMHSPTDHKMPSFRTLCPHPCLVHRKAAYQRSTSTSS